MTQYKGGHGAKSAGAPAVLAFFVAAIAASFASGYFVENHFSAARRNDSGPRFAQASPGRSAFNGTEIPQNGRTGDLQKAGADDGAVPAATFESVYSLVNEHFVDELPSEHEMSTGALRSMLATLNDPNSTFLDADAAAIFRNEAQGKYAGIGASLFVQSVVKDGYTDHKIVVVSTLPGSPAEKAGLRNGDVITHVDGKWILGSDPFLKVNHIVQKLQDAKKNSDTEEVQRESDEARRQQSGGIGMFKAQLFLRGDTAIRREYHLSASPIQLTVERRGMPAGLSISLAAADTEVAPIVPYIGADGSLELKLAAFTPTSAEEVSAALHDQNGSPGRWIVLDLRGNAGGVGDGSSALESASQVAAIFLSKGAATHPFAIVQRPGGARTTLSAALPVGAARAAQHVDLAHVAVLVDAGTAGAAEALAAALADSGASSQSGQSQKHSIDSKGANLVGTRTFGANIVQTIYPLPDHQSAFSLVTGTLRNPKNISWGGTGLAPKIAVAPGAGLAEVIAAVKTADHQPQITTRKTAQAAIISPRSPSVPER